jgi:hypothetical protein
MSEIRQWRRCLELSQYEYNETQLSNTQDTLMNTRNYRLLLSFVLVEEIIFTPLASFFMQCSSIDQSQIQQTSECLT